jgi:lysophospholipid acyltransferase (LPLAT)-like uncharacterized protein
MRSDYPIKHDETKTARSRLVNLGHLLREADAEPVSAASLGRNRLTRTLDWIIAAVRKYLPPIHWLAAGTTAIVLYIYVRFVALTAKQIGYGEWIWPDIPAPAVIALWHRDAPSLLVAFVQRRPTVRCVILVGTDARGDCLSLLCRLAGFGVVRGGRAEGGWQALIELSHALATGACVFVTADGGGPARIAKVGAIVLASAADVPLVLLSADCQPAIVERHKWDTARNPLPFSTLTIEIGPSRSFGSLSDLTAIEKARRWLEDELNRAGGRPSAEQ